MFCISTKTIVCLSVLNTRVKHDCTPLLKTGERREGEGKQKVEEEECENNNGQQAHKVSSDSLPPPGLAEIHR